MHTILFVCLKLNNLLMLLDFVKISNVGKKRDSNQDYAEVYTLAEGLLAIVCDGVGGNKGGEIASELATKTIAETFNTLKRADYLSRLSMAMLTANHEILEFAGNNSNVEGMATTSVAVFLSAGRAYWGHVGDSRIYFYSKGKLVQLTKDHSLVQKMVDEGLITDTVAKNHPYKNVIIRALGETDGLTVDYSQFDLPSEDSWKILLCSDGVSNQITKEELTILLKEEELDYISDKIINLVEDRGSPDNYTFILISKR